MVIGKLKQWVLVALMLVTSGNVGTVHATVVALHPLHTSITDANHDRANKTLTLTVRVFADDFIGALSQGSARTNASHTAGTRLDWQKAASAYLTRALTVRDTKGNPLALKTCGITQAGDVLLLCLRLSNVGDVRGLQISNTILFERFEDQLSIVRVTARDKSRTYILTRKSISATIS